MTVIAQSNHWVLMFLVSPQWKHPSFLVRQIQRRSRATHFGEAMLLLWGGGRLFGYMVCKILAFNQLWLRLFLRIYIT